MEERAYQHWLYSIDGIGEATRKKLYERIGSAEEIYKSPEKQVISLLTERQRDAFRKARRNNPEQDYETLVKSGIRFLTQDDADYPRKLRDIPDAPLALYAKGRLPDDEKFSVAVVGARFCSSYGRYMARQFGMELAASGFQVISGMALGVDGIAQTAALSAGGYSMGVLGCGADVCYPPENRALYDRLCSDGGILSEYAPGTVPKPGLFPPRNRIISGLADCVLVVEARAKSGTLITVDMALEQGRDVFALPGRATDRLSDGCNLLLKQGAVPAMSAADIVEYYTGVKDEEKKQKEADQKAEKAALMLSDKERLLMDALDIHPKPAAEIIEEPALREAGISAQEWMCALTELALRGLIGQEGNCFARKL